MSFRLNELAQPLMALLLLVAIVIASFLVIAPFLVATLWARRLFQRHAASYADDAPWLERSRQFGCRGKSARQIVASARGLRNGSLPVMATAVP